MSSNKTTTALSVDLTNKAKEFGCVKCSVKLQDVKLLKNHYWKVHIRQKDIEVAENELFKIKYKSDATTKNNGKQKRKINNQSKQTVAKKTKTAAKENTSLANQSKDGETRSQDSEENKQIDSDTDSDDETSEYSKKKIRRIESLPKEEIKFFNLSKDIVESDLVEKAQLFYKKDKDQFVKSVFGLILNPILYVFC
jgi:hypothetical protein